MIRGIVSNDGVPTITLSVAGQDWVAIIDTGFNGDLELPEDLRDSLKARHVGRVTSALAGSQTIEMVQAEATFVPGSQILIGTHLLQQYRLQINFVSKTVRLERVEQP